MPETDIAQTLVDAVERGASDILLKVGNSPLARIDGELLQLNPGDPKLMPPDTERMARSLMPEYRIKEFENEQEADFAYAVPGLGRFRVNAFKQRGSISMVLRSIPIEAPTFDQLNLPDVVRTLAEEERGIVLVTGTTGSGKSTTLAAMISHINATMRKHIVTVEDPIEYLYRDDLSAIDQREVGSDTASFKRALRRVLRQDPDVILIGEMRDEETVQTALSAAETGHLVFSTLHTADAGETVNRILEFYEPHEQTQARSMLASVLRGVISQRLVPTADGEGRTAILEVLRSTGRVQDTIKDGDVSSLPDIIGEGAFYGMMTFDQALYNAVTDGRVSMETALTYASKPHDFKLLIQGEGRTGTSMDDVQQGGGENAPEVAPGRDPTSLIPGL
ncbi:MAG: twitching motility protein PilT [Frankiaceae bacterium]|jgi:twitching motility protein PilT|nr:twitching motility protein PilT [Frankiaceae bacterium]